MKKHYLVLIVLSVLLIFNFSCTKEFIAAKKSKVVVVRSKAFSDIDYTDNTTSYTIRGDLSLIITEPETNYSYNAETYGTASNGSQVGEKISWSRDFTLESDTTTEKLETTTDYFYLFVNNTSSKDYGPFTVNFGNSDQITENLLIPNNGMTYRVAYYKTHSNTKVRFYEYNNNSSYITVTAGQDFHFPNTDNQCVVLEISGKGFIKTSYITPDKSSYLELIENNY